MIDPVALAATLSINEIKRLLKARERHDAKVAQLKEKRQKLVDRIAETEALISELTGPTTPPRRKAKAKKAEVSAPPAKLVDQVHSLLVQKGGQSPMDEVMSKVTSNARQARVV